MVKIIISLLCFCLLLSDVAANVKASINKSHIAISDMLSLTISVSSSVASIRPDLSGVQKNFDIVSTSASQRYSYINGVASQRMEWLYQLVPLKVGNIVIPALKINGEMTQPLTIVVSDNKKNVSQKKNLFIVVSTSPENAYVQSQVLLTQKIYAAGSLPGNATLSEPAITEGVADVEFLKQRDPYIEKKEGVTYQVIERYYLIYPQKSGTLSFSPAIFGGYVTDNSSTLRFPFNSFRGRRIHVASDKLSLNVLPQPSQFSGKEWLPAQNIELYGNWSSPLDQLKVGEPVTFSLGIMASGIRAEQLPDLTISLPEHIKMYPETAHLQNNQAQRLIVGVKTQKITLIPSKAGVFSFPKLSLKWWDIVNNEEKIATLKETILTVSSNTIVQSVDDEQTNIKSHPELANKVEAKPLAAVEKHANNQSLAPIKQHSNTHWKDIILGLIIGLLLAGTLWLITPLITHFKHQKNNKRSIAMTNLSLKEACISNDPYEANRLLILWAKHYFSPAPASLAALSKQASPELKQAIGPLNDALYGPQKTVWKNSQALWKAVERYDHSREIKPEEKQALDSLYPD